MMLIKNHFLEPKRKSINNFLSNKKVLYVIVNVNKELIFITNIEKLSLFKKLMF